MRKKFYKRKTFLITISLIFILITITVIKVFNSKKISLESQPIKVNSYTADNKVETQVDILQQSQNLSMQYGEQRILSFSDLSISTVKYTNTNDSVISIEQNTNIIKAIGVGKSTITILINDNITRVINVQVNKALVDVVLFSGQSNMQGQNENESIPNLEQYTGMSYEYKYLTNQLVEVKDPVGEDIKGGSEPGWNPLDNALNTSLVPSFVKKYNEITGRKIVVVHAARPGAEIAKFLPGSTSGTYEATVAKYNAAINYLQSNSDKFEIGLKFYVFLQGEYDAKYGTSKEDYKTKFLQMHNSLKRDCALEACAIIKVGYIYISGQNLINATKVIQTAQEELINENEDIVLASNKAVEYSDPSCYTTYMRNQNPYYYHFKVGPLREIGTDAAIGTAEALKDKFEEPDTIAPSIEITSNNGSETKIKHIDVGISISDNSGKVKEIKYVWKEKNENIQMSDFKDNIYETNAIISSPSNLNGEYYLYVYSIDESGNEKTIRSNVFNFDNTPPEVQIEYSNEEYVNGNIIVTITSNEEIQEIQGFTISQDKMSITKEYESNVQETVNIKDIAGNEKSIEIFIKNIDKNPPTDMAPDAVASINSIKVISKQEDNESGIRKIQYAIYSNGEWSSWQDNDTFENLVRNTEYQVKTRAIDNVGNMQESQILKINTQETEKVNVKVSVLWDDDNNIDGIRAESVKIVLKSNNNNIKNYELSDSNDWKYTFTDLEKYDESEKEILYSVDSENVPTGYTKTITQNAPNDYVITYTHIQEKAQIIVEKIWVDNNDQDKIRPSSIKAVLLKNNNIIEGTEVTLNDTNNWTYTFNDLPVYESGEKIQYSVEELEIPEGYTSQVKETTPNTYTIINMHETSEKYITVKKEWDDSNNQDGIRPDSVEIVLLANDLEKETIRLDNSNNWMYVFDNLPTKEDDKIINYSIKENNLTEGYESSIEENIPNEYTVKNSHIPETMDIPINIVWDDKDNQDLKRPESFKLTLLADGEAKEEIEFSKNNNWTNKFSNIPKKNNGTTIKYTFMIDILPEGYEVTLSGSEEEGYTINIKYVSNKKFDLALREFITGINDEEITNRVPEVDTSKYGTTHENGNIITNFTYNHTKDPVKVCQNDTVIYTIRVYNEGTMSGYAEEIKDDIPEGLIFLPENSINQEYRWVMYDEDGNITTDVTKAVYIRSNYLSKENEKTDGENLLQAFDTETMEGPDYRDVKIAFKVTQPNTSDRIIINQAQISNSADIESKDVTDIDSNTNEWIEGEDDQDIEKIYVQYFDLALKNWVSQIILNENGIEKVKDTENSAEQVNKQLVRVDLNKNRINNAVIKFKYQIQITNEGEIAGTAKEISSYIPKGLEFNQADNPLWKESDGKVVTDQLKDTIINPGESATVEIMLRWKNSEENMGAMTITTEISKDYNSSNTPDIDSIPNNKEKGEDDIGDAIVVLSIVTGRTPIYIGITAGILSIIAGGIFLIKRYIL